MRKLRTGLIGCGKVGHLHAVIQARFGASFLGMSLAYVIEESPLGTGGAIRNTLPLAEENSVLVLNGDTFLNADYAAMLRFHLAEAAPLTMAVTRQPDIARYASRVVVMRDGLVQTDHQQEPLLAKVAAAAAGSP